MARTSLQDPAPRPPVVAVLGHIDHGKTTLLDRLRSTRVAEHEAGQITQSLTGSAVSTWQGRVTFLDTPGHEAFEAMRARGAAFTDLVLLVVSATDGVQAMTRQVAARAAYHRLPVVVAISKIDAEGADPERVRRQLLTLGLVPEELGGDALVREVSAVTGQGLDELVEALALQAMMQQLRAAPEGPGKGFVLDAMLDERLGPRARVLVREGTIRVGDRCQVGRVVGWVRAMFDDQQRPLKEALPSVPVDIVGLGSLPPAGAELQVIDQASDDEPLPLAHEPPRPRSALEWQLWREASEQPRIKVLLRAASQGALEALHQALQGLHQGALIDVVRASVGRITENDVKVAAAFRAVILGFGVRVLRDAAELAAHEGVKVLCEDTIYRVVDHVARLCRALAPVQQAPQPPALRMASFPDRRRCGMGEVVQLFEAEGARVVAGVRLLEGEVFDDSPAKVTRLGHRLSMARVTSLRIRRNEKSYLSVHRKWRDDERTFGLCLEPCEGLQPGDLLLFFDARG